jgi:hypothetical protein
MIKRKKKICKSCLEEKYLFSKGLCKYCYLLIKPPLINKRSNKKIEQDKHYNKIRKQFLEEHPFCEIGLEGCTRVATEIHHTKGKGIHYLDTDTFKAICNHCHILITEHSKEAIDKGYSQSRLKKE